MNDISYALSAWVLSKGVAFCFAIAFLSLIPQIMGLYGKNGILSIHQFMLVLKEQTGPQRYYELPTIFWLNSSDFFLNAVASVGLFASTLAFVGFSPPLMMIIAWFCYLSFVNSGQDFLGFQWDSLLLEVGLLSFFLTPLAPDWDPWRAFEPSPFVRWLFWLLLFKLMFLSGTMKILSKDPSWRDHSAMKYHYWTQPLPNPLAYFMDKMPGWFQTLSCRLLFSVELGASFLIFIPGKMHILCSGIFIFLQFLILATGNYAFFNTLTIVLSLFLLDDTAWKPLLSHFLPSLSVSSVASPFYQSLGIIIAAILLPLNFFWFLLAFRENSPFLDPILPIIRAIYNYRFNSSYGLFAVMTKDRSELILQGSDDTENWIEYEFKYKPSSLSRMPPLVAPYHPRLDWQMWFAALGTFSQNLWLQNLMARIFLNSEDVLKLLKENPFPHVPKYLRLVKYKYKFTSLRELFEKGEWWRREYVGLYSPVFEKSDFVVEE